MDRGVGNRDGVGYSWSCNTLTIYETTREEMRSIITIIYYFKTRLYTFFPHSYMYTRNTTSISKEYRCNIHSYKNPMSKYQ